MNNSHYFWKKCQNLCWRLRNFMTFFHNNNQNIIFLSGYLTTKFKIVKILAARLKLVITIAYVLE